MLRGKPGRTPIDRDRIALKLLERARAGTPGLHAVWYGGGLSIAIKRTAVSDIESIPWREADRLAFPEDYAEKEVPRKPNARFQGRAQTRRLAT